MSEIRPRADEPVKGAVTLTAATVSAGNVDTPYHRLGSGPPVVALGIWADLDAQAIPQGLLVLSASCRIVVPDLDRVVTTALPVGPVAATFVAWLGGFLDGLGLASSSVIATWTLEEQLMGAVDSLSGRIDRIVTVGGPAARSLALPPTEPAPLPDLAGREQPCLGGNRQVPIRLVTVGQGVGQ